MRTFRSFMSHKFTIRQSLIIIGAAILAGFIANRLAVASGWSDGGVNALSLAAAIATFFPLEIVFYRRAHA